MITAAIVASVMLYAVSAALCFIYGPRSYYERHDGSMRRHTDPEVLISVSTIPILNTICAVYYPYRYYIDKDFNDTAAKLYAMNSEKRVDDIRKALDIARQDRIEELERLTLRG